MTMLIKEITTALLLFGMMYLTIIIMYSF